MFDLDQSQLGNGQVPNTRRTLIAVLICGGLAALLTAAMLSLSARTGRMAAPLAYDDVAYAFDGLTVYKSLIAGDKLLALSQLMHAHAPLQSALAVLAQFVFGFHEWAFYAANAWMVLALILAVLWIVRPLRILPQIAIVLVVLCTPVTANVVTEFRPDLWWGFLCGLSVYLIFDPRFLRGSITYQACTALVSALALLGKPSGSLATGILLAYAATASFLLVLREQSATRHAMRGCWKRFGVFLAAVAMLIAPYYLQNIEAIYHYLRFGFVEQIDVYRQPGDLWWQLAYFPAGPISRFALYLTFWLGLVVFAINVVLLWRTRNVAALLRYLAYAAAVFAAYSAPTISPIKSFYIGGIFYGTFLIFTVHGLVLIFEALEAYFLNVARIAAVALLLACVASFQPNPLIRRHAIQQAAERTALNEKLVAVLSKEVRGALGPPPILYVAGPEPVTHTYVALRLKWLDLNLNTTTGYYARTMEEQLDLMRHANFVVLTEAELNRYPGEILTPELLKAAISDPGLMKIVDFTDSRGRHTYLFVRPSARVMGLVGTWVPSRGLTIRVSCAAIKRLPIIKLQGRADYRSLSRTPSVSATVDIGSVARVLPAMFQRNGSSYEIIVDASGLKCDVTEEERVLDPSATESEGDDILVNLVFDTFFVPKELGINNSTAELVVRAPTEVRLLARAD